jgi:hypothetical protein
VPVHDARHGNRDENPSRHNEGEYNGAKVLDGVKDAVKAKQYNRESVRYRENKHSTRTQVVAVRMVTALYLQELPDSRAHGEEQKM